jgi:hypothetical protein
VLTQPPPHGLLSLLARWLHMQGATSVVVAGMEPPNLGTTPPVESGAAGVVTLKADFTQRASVVAAFEMLQARMPDATVCTVFLDLEPGSHTTEKCLVNWRSVCAERSPAGDIFVLSPLAPALHQLDIHSTGSVRVCHATYVITRCAASTGLSLGYSLQLERAAIVRQCAAGHTFDQLGPAFNAGSTPCS